MRREAALLLALLLAGCCAATAPPPVETSPERVGDAGAWDFTAPTDWPAAVRSSFVPGQVLVTAGSHFGSGVVLHAGSRGTYVLTNLHVVCGWSPGGDLRVWFPGAGGWIARRALPFEPSAAEVGRLVRDRASADLWKAPAPIGDDVLRACADVIELLLDGDLAVLLVDALVPDPPSRPLAAADSGPPWRVVVLSPTPGVVELTDPPDADLPLRSARQLEPGNSGSGVFDGRGELVGLVQGVVRSGSPAGGSRRAREELFRSELARVRAELARNDQDARRVLLDDTTRSTGSESVLGGLVIPGAAIRAWLEARGLSWLARPER